MKTTFFLTEVAKDWTSTNLSVIAEVLREADDATRTRTDKDKDPLLDQPNYRNFVGYVRWMMVAKLLFNALRRFDNVIPRWVDLGGVSALELRGTYTTVTPCHLMSETTTPNDTLYRRDLRIENQVCPLLFADLSNQPSENKPLRLLLVHGGRSSRFAYLRAYIDAEDQSIYRDLTQNILLMPALLQSIDYEQIDEPKIGLNETDEQKGTGENPK